MDSALTHAMKNTDVAALLEQIGADLEELLRRRKIDTPLLIGIQTGGVWIAQKLHQMFGLSEPLGELNIHFYRDDFSQIGLHPRVGASSLPVSVENRHIILVDDVLHTGRTVRAALNEIFDYGRPDSIQLVVLINRGGKELPICADIIGQTVTLPDAQNIKLQGPNSLQLLIQ